MIADKKSNSADKWRRNRQLAKYWPAERRGVGFYGHAM
jgi:hypothetical protein